MNLSSKPGWSVSLLMQSIAKSCGSWPFPLCKHNNIDHPGLNMWIRKIFADSLRNQVDYLLRWEQWSWNRYFCVLIRTQWKLWSLLASYIFILGWVIIANPSRPSSLLELYEDLQGWLYLNYIWNCMPQTDRTHCRSQQMGLKLPLVNTPLNKAAFLLYQYFMPTSPRRNHLEYTLVWLNALTQLNADASIKRRRLE